MSSVPRPDALGGVWYNPALLTLTDRITIGYGQYAIPVLEDDGGFRGGAFAAPLGNQESGVFVGAGVSRFTFGTTDLISENGERLGDQFPRDILANAAVALRMAEAHSFGVAVAYTDTRTQEGRAGIIAFEDQVWGANFGYLYMPSLPLGGNHREEMGGHRSTSSASATMSPVFSLALANVGPDIVYQEGYRPEEQATTFHTGLGVQLSFHKRMQGVPDGTNPVEVATFFAGFELERALGPNMNTRHIGVELLLVRMCGVRVGRIAGENIRSRTTYGARLGTGDLFPIEFIYEFAHVPDLFYSRDNQHEFRVTIHPELLSLR